MIYLSIKDPNVVLVVEDFKIFTKKGDSIKSPFLYLLQCETEPKIFL